jgi:hypothetical protein
MCPACMMAAALAIAGATSAGGLAAITTKVVRSARGLTGLDRGARGRAASDASHSKRRSDHERP